MDASFFGFQFLHPLTVLRIHRLFRHVFLYLFSSDDIKEVVALGEENVISVDTAAGGKGRLTCQVIQQPASQSTAAATLLPVETEDNRDGTTTVYYTPTQLGQLAVELRYGGQLIPNGEFTQKVCFPVNLIYLVFSRLVHISHSYRKVFVIPWSRQYCNQYPLLIFFLDRLMIANSLTVRHKIHVRNVVLQFWTHLFLTERPK